MGRGCLVGPERQEQTGLGSILSNKPDFSVLSRKDTRHLQHTHTHTQPPPVSLPLTMSFKVTSPESARTGFTTQDERGWV